MAAIVSHDDGSLQIFFGSSYSLFSFDGTFLEVSLSLVGFQNNDPRNYGMDSRGLMALLYFPPNNNFYYIMDRVRRKPENLSPRKALERKSLMLTQRQPISPRLCFPYGRYSLLELP